MRDIFAKALRSNLKAAVALLGLIVLGVAVGSYILSNQRLNPPAWMPIVGEDTFEIKAEVESAQGILPGQGQAVNVSGVKVGDIASVHLEEGRAIATLRIEERFARVYPNASILLRPKTGLKDMVVELDPGSPSSGDPLDEGAMLSNKQTLADVNFDEFLASLDGDTQDYLKLLVGDAGRTLRDGGGRDLANTFRRFQPLSRDFAKANKYVVQRRQKLKRVIHNFSAIMTELGAHDRELARFVGGSAEVFRRFANQNENLSETIELLPGALRSGNTALAKIDRLGRSMESTFTNLEPTARALGPSLRQLRPFFAQTEPVIQRQLRPFTEEVRPIARDLRRPARNLSRSIPDLVKFTEVFNALFNELAYDPPGEGKGKNGYLYYLPWANHNTNSIISSQDGISTLRRSLIMISCSQLNALEVFSKPSEITGEIINPYLATLIKLLNAPSTEERCGTGASQ
ncbi:MAG TPA: MlaD family protein [Thermoleophilaceae bacterium]|nr:MlaD family protein [Thermoleophilaceae bacterium]